MDRYIVTRSSTWGEEKPVPEAVKVSVLRSHFVSPNSTQTFREMMKRRSERFEEIEGGGFNAFFREDAWACDIEDLKDFVKEHGCIILTEPDNEEGFWGVEIYDYYRE